MAFVFVEKMAFVFVEKMAFVFVEKMAFVFVLTKMAFDLYRGPSRPSYLAVYAYFSFIPC